MSLEPIAQVPLGNGACDCIYIRLFASAQLRYMYILILLLLGLILPLFPQADLALITEVAARVDEAVASFEVQHTEELVVPFGEN